MQALVAAFHRRSPIRVWSLIVTMFGDCVAPRGGEIGMQPLTALLDAAGVSGGVVRTAMSRLAQDGWVERLKDGRNSFYRLSAFGRHEVEVAAPRIYGRPTETAVPLDGPLEVDLVILPPGTDLETTRAALRAVGYAAVSGTVLWRPKGAASAGSPEFVGPLIRLEATIIDGASLAATLMRTGSGLDGLRSAYETVAALAEPLCARPPRNPLQALVARLLLIHEFRRVALRDPQLPTTLLPSGWPGETCRRVVADAYRAVLPASEAWLDQHGTVRGGHMPPPAVSLSDRFVL